MESNDFFGNQSEDSGKACKIKFYANGTTKLVGRIQANALEDDINKIKKRLLKLLKFENYKSQKFQDKVRLFTKRGIELTEHDMQDLCKQDSLFYSLQGEDFDFKIRVNALKF